MAGDDVDAGEVRESRLKLKVGAGGYEQTGKRFQHFEHMEELISIRLWTFILEPQVSDLELDDGKRHIPERQ